MVLNGKEAFSVSEMYIPCHFQGVMLENYLYSINICADFLTASFAMREKNPKYLKVYQEETGKGNYHISVQT